jgi:hypothetical protein
VVLAVLAVDPTPLVTVPLELAVEVVEAVRVVAALVLAVPIDPDVVDGLVVVVVVVAVVAVDELEIELETMVVVASVPSVLRGMATLLVAVGSALGCGEDCEAGLSAFE